MPSLRERFDSIPLWVFHPAPLYFFTSIFFLWGLLTNPYGLYLFVNVLSRSPVILFTIGYAMLTIWGKERIWFRPIRKKITERQVQKLLEEQHKRLSSEFEKESASLRSHISMLKLSWKIMSAQCQFLKSKVNAETLNKYFVITKEVLHNERLAIEEITRTRPNG